MDKPGVGGDIDECGTESLVSGVRGRMDPSIHSSTLRWPPLSRLFSFLSPPSRLYPQFSFPFCFRLLLPPKKRAQAKFRRRGGELAEHMMQHKVMQLSERSNEAGKSANEPQ